MKYLNNLLPGILVLSLVLLCLPLEICSQTFTDITASCGLEAIRNQKPAGWWLSGLHLVDLDFDNDLDLFLSCHDGAAWWARNDGNGNFTTGTPQPFSREIHLAYDINEDGKLDLTLTYQDGGGQWWTNATTAAGGAVNFLGGITRDATRIQALMDLNKDGKVDWIYGTVEYGNGDGTFTGTAALGAMGFFFDLDNDGDYDIAGDGGAYDVQNGTGQVYMNNGSASFSNATATCGIGSIPLKGGGDLDQDGDIDLIGLDSRQLPAAIYINDGSAHFTRKAGAVSGGSKTAAYGDWGLATVTDFDNDGIPDIILDGKNFLQIYRGTGSGNFTYMNTTWGIADLADASVDGGVCFGDIDHDGDLDILGYTEIWPNRYFKVYRNDLPAKNWINVRPVGLAGNKGAAGAKIRLYEAGTRNLLWYDQVTYFGSQACQNYYGYAQAERHMGLNTRASCDVEVEFYPSGTKVAKSGATRNTTWVINENGTIGELPVGRENGQQSAVSGQRVELSANPNPFNPAATIVYNVETLHATSLQLSIYDAAGKYVATLVDGPQTPGIHSVTWDAANHSSGIYVLRLQTPGQVITKRIILSK